MDYQPWSADAERQLGNSIADKLRAKNSLLLKALERLLAATENHRKWYDTCTKDLSHSSKLNQACDVSVETDAAINHAIVTILKVKE